MTVGSSWMRIAAVVTAIAPSGPSRAGTPNLAPIPRDQITRVQASTTSDASASQDRRFRPKHLVDLRDWSAWGSDPNDADGPWVEISFDRVSYVQRIDFVPGDARNRVAFERCGRPAILRVEGGGVSHSFELRDRRWGQSVEIRPVMGARTIRLVAASIHGQSIDGGVCLSELRFLAPLDVFTSLPELKARAQRERKRWMSPSASPETRAAALEALVAIGPPVVQLLLDELDGPERSARALEALARIGDPSAIPRVARLLRSPHPDLRKAALATLGALGSRAHYDVIRRWYDESDGAERDRAFVALVRTGHPGALASAVSGLLGDDPARGRHAADALPLYGASALEALRPFLGAKSAEKRALALRVVGNLRLAEVRSILMQAREDARPEIRVAALPGLGNHPDERAHSAVVSHLDSPLPEERAAAASAIGQMGYPADLKRLLALTSDASTVVGVAAVVAMGRMGGQATPHLLGLANAGAGSESALAAAHGLLSRSPDTAVRLLMSRHGAVRRLAGEHLRLRGAAGRRALAQAVISDEAELRAAAAAEIKRRNTPFLDDLLEATASAPPDAIADVLDLVGHIGDPAGVGWAAQYLATDWSPRLRRAAVEAVARCGGTPRDVLGPLMTALEDPAPEVRAAAVAAVGRRRLTAATSKLIELLESDTYAVQRAATNALGNLRNAGALEALERVYRRTRQDRGKDSFRKDLVLAAGRIGGPDSLPLLIDAMSDRNHGVRKAAELSLAP